ncbi:MAG TPA: IS21 family transposase [Candidatus Bathyarchaeia archaeon]|nr:IS21 family transposase [Candidatus Bathyarchaeia archaeon]
MIAPELRTRIRRLFFAEHWRIGTIAGELGVHHDTVRRAIEAERFLRPGVVHRPSMLDAYKAFVGETLEQHPRLRATRLFEMARDRGYRGSVVQLRRYIATVRPAPRSEAYLRLQTLPGEQAQVDWGHFGTIRVGHAKRALSCFVMVLSWSRAIFARFALDQTLESFQRGHIEAFAALGGVPRTILYDNLKSVVLERAGDHIRFNEAMLFFAGHYHFAPKPCAPYRGNEKGKVERTIQYLRDGFFAARRFSSVQDLNAQLAAWIERTAHARKVPGDPEGRLVRDALLEERPRLLALPEHPYDCHATRWVTSGKQPYVRFDRNDYSIPHHLVGKPLVLVATEDEIRITNGSHVFATHRRSWDEKQVIEDPAHIEELAREKRRAHDLRGRDRLRAACPSADPFLEALAVRGEHLGGQVARLLKLLDRYDAVQLEAGLKDALARGAIGAASVAHVLDQRARARRHAPKLDVVLPDDPRVRNLRVTPHALDSYDALAKPKKETP